MLQKTSSLISVFILCYGCLFSGLYADDAEENVALQKMAALYGGKNITKVAQNLQKLYDQLDKFIAKANRRMIKTEAFNEKAGTIKEEILETEEALRNELGEKKAENLIKKIQSKTKLDRSQKRLRERFLTHYYYHEIDEEKAMAGIVVLNTNEFDYYNEETSLLSNNTFADFARKVENKRKAGSRRTSQANILNFDWDDVHKQKDIQMKHGIWIGGGKAAVVNFGLTDKIQYAGDKSLYLQFRQGNNDYNNWISVSVALQKPIRVNNGGTIEFYIYSPGSGGTVSIALQNGNPAQKYEFKDVFALNRHGWTRIEAPLDSLRGTGYEYSELAITFTRGKFQEKYQVGWELPGYGYKNFVYQYYEPNVHSDESLLSTVFIDEVSFVQKSSGLSAGKGKFELDGHAIANYNALTGIVPHMMNFGRLKLSYVTPKYDLGIKFAVDPQGIIEDYMDSAFEYPVELAPEYYYYSTRKWGWNFPKGFYFEDLDFNIKNLKYIKKITFGAIDMNFGHLLLSSIYNPMGISLDGEMNWGDTKYSLRFIKHEGAGYGVAGSLLSQIEPLNIDVRAAALYEDQRGKYIEVEDNYLKKSSGLYNSRSFQNAVLALTELGWEKNFSFKSASFLAQESEKAVKEVVAEIENQGAENRNETETASSNTNIKTNAGTAAEATESKPVSRDRLKNIINLKTWGGIYFSEEKWNGSYALANDRELIYEQGNNNNLRGIAADIKLDTTFLFATGISLLAGVEYRYVGEDFGGMGQGCDLKSITYNYAPYLRNHPFRESGRFLTESEGKRDGSMDKFYWQDLSGFMCKTGFAWKWFDLHYILDLTRRVTMKEKKRNSHHLKAGFNIWVIGLSYSLRTSKFENDSDSGFSDFDDVNPEAAMAYLKHELALKIMPVDNFYILGAYAKSKYGAKDSLGEFSQLLYDNDIWYTTTVLRLFHNVNLFFTFKSVQDTAGRTDDLAAKAEGETETSFGASFKYLSTGVAFKF
ncbi:MAG TPA: hypothetical protein VKS21_00690 [Spirochaetota bacterium]|nr:hypothetical protein [Spirochaetota bacterium]